MLLGASFYLITTLLLSKFVIILQEWQTFLGKWLDLVKVTCFFFFFKSCIQINKDCSSVLKTKAGCLDLNLFAFSLINLLISGTMKFNCQSEQTCTKFPCREFTLFFQLLDQILSLITGKKSNNQSWQLLDAKKGLACHCCSQLLVMSSWTFTIF